MMFVGFRKVFAFVFIEGIATFAWLSGIADMTAELWVAVSEWTFAAFVFGNAVEHTPKLTEALGSMLKKK